ncbi:hypothetical protein K0M31_020269 [Melipona bicolor]|uniref:Uncharacterized protein n=1 Tax=Melipona bicolor TaxID=60889 RepID=A0AA40G158_9HYME|nr:hypothetical protein K0M31_020269 [Melipona bicolor]
MAEHCGTIRSPTAHRQAITSHRRVPSQTITNRALVATYSPPLGDFPPGQLRHAWVLIGLPAASFGWPGGHHRFVQSNAIFAFVPREIVETGVGDRAGLVDGLFRWIVRVRDRVIGVAEVDSVVGRCVLLKDRGKERHEGTLGNDVFSSGTLLTKNHDDSRAVVKGAKFNGFSVLYASSGFVMDKDSRCH